MALLSSSEILQDSMPEEERMRAPISDQSTASPNWFLAGYSLEASLRRLDSLIPAFTLGLCLYYFQMFTQLAGLLNCIDIIHLDISSTQKQFRWERNWLLRIRAPWN